jgi:membrane protease YdiL (CAAX protease family)
MEDEDERLDEPSQGPSSNPANPSEDGSRGRPHADQDPGRQGFVRTALIFYGAMGCAALIWRMAASSDSIFAPGGGAADGASSVWTAAGAGLVVGLASVAISELLTRGTELGERLADTLGESLAGISLGDAILLAVASGMAEEMLFRGALQPAVGLVWASLIFGACHFLPRREIAIWSLYAVAMGFAFGWLFDWTGHLLAPIVAHTVVNGINLPRLARRAPQTTDD